jgi:AAA family ATP:ADP antiporter
MDFRSRTQRLVARVTGAEPDEAVTLAWGFAWFFCLLLAYYVLRPVRETLGVERGVEGLKWLFTATFIGMLLAVPLYSALVARVGRKRLVPIAYRFFAMNLLLFWFALRTDGATRDFASSAFFVWVSIFNLFAVSIFWSFQADIFSSAQGKRLFGFIAAGGTLGAVLGSLITAELSSFIGTANLLLLPLVLLEVALFCARRLDLHASSLSTAGEPSGEDRGGTGGGLFEGFSATFRSPYLLAIAAYTLCNALLGTTIYFQQAEVVKAAIEDEAARTAFFARLNLWVQFATVGVQVLITARLLKAVGVAVALCILPLIYAVGVGVLGFAPTLAVLAVIDVLRRAGSYAITTPSREVLFTSVARTEKYKAKSFLDTVVFRGGDALAGHAFNALRALGAGGLWMAAIMIPIAGAWAWIGHKAGRMHQAASRKVELKA